jgi:signal transduction histidine kinase
MQKDLGDHIYLLVIICTCGISLLVTTFVYIFIRNQKKILEQSERAQRDALAHQKELLYSTIRSQEEERQRIGRNLHDDVGGSLSNLRMLLNRPEHLGPEMLKQQPGIYNQLIDNIIQDVRNISHNLSPPALALFGFSEALLELRDIVGNGDESFFSISNQAEAATDALQPIVALALIRILQELITNTVKHAGAKRIVLSLSAENDQLVMHYADDGKGYDMADVSVRRGMGMQNIEARINMISASYTIKTAINEGFAISIYVTP